MIFKKNNLNQPSKRNIKETNRETLKHVSGSRGHWSCQLIYDTDNGWHTTCTYSNNYN